MAFYLSPKALLLALLASASLHTASAQHFMDLNSLQAFIPATTANDLAIFSPDQSPQNGSSTFSSIPATTRLAKRQNACGSYNSCANQGAPGLCCPTNQVCSANLGRVGCCPVGAACTGQIPGAGGVVATATSFQSGGYTITTTAVTTTAEAIVTGSGGFVLAGTETVAVLGSSGVVLRPPLVLRLAGRFYRMLYILWR